MSAIAGMIDWRGGPAGPAVRKATAALALHGRDGEGIWDGGDVALGWRQTILHTEDYADRQPLTGGGGRFHLAFDGRIDNRAELATLLALDPERAREMPDSAYALAAFEKWSEDCAAHLLGDFAFALWNADRRTLFLARDHIGARPLFFHANPRFFMFASAPSALFANPEVPRDIDDNAFLLHLATIPSDPDGTIYLGIARVPLGHSITISNKAVRTACHWNPDAIPELRYKRDEDYVEAFQEILDESVRCRLRTIHPIGSHLSSGLDSSTVTVTAARLLAHDGRSLTAFTAVPPRNWNSKVETDAIVDEGKPAARLAKLCNFDHVPVEVGQALDFEIHDRHCAAFEAPRRAFANVGWIEKLSLDARARGVRVMLSGGFGNRTISHDGMVRLPLLARRGQFTELVREWAYIHRRSNMRYRALAAITFGPFTPEWIWDLHLLLRGRPAITELMRCGLHPGRFSERQLKRFGRNKLANPTNAHRLDDRMMRAVCSRSPDVASIWGSTLAAYDIETRDPTADKRMIAFRVAVPERQFLYRGEAKWLLRRAMKNKLPDFILDQRHHAGRQAAEWFEAASQALPALHDEIKKLAANSRVASAIDIEWLGEMLDKWPKALDDNSIKSRRYRRFLIVVTFARFMRRFIEHTR